MFIVAVCTNRPSQKYNFKGKGFSAGESDSQISWQ